MEGLLQAVQLGQRLNQLQDVVLCRGGKVAVLNTARAHIGSEAHAGGGGTKSNPVTPYYHLLE